MGVWRSIAGVLSIEIMSASPGETLAAISKAGIELHNVVQTGDLTVSITVFRSDYEKISKILMKRGDDHRVLKRKGIYWSVTGIRKRPVLLLFLLIYAVLLIYLPTRVLFIEVRGNRSVSSETILSEAENCGIYFGASRRAVRSEKMKNELLGAIPQLQWAGVNTYGCVAVITVEERDAAEEKETVQGVQSIVASQDGVIRQMTVLRGNPICQVGQAVKAGQVLVSGYTDCGLSIKAESAQAEIYADTMRKLEVITPAVRLERTGRTHETKKYSLIVGKKLINLFKDSGISDSTCVKMYTRYALTLPGGFRLPVCLIEYRCAVKELQETELTSEQELDWMAQYAQKYLQEQMTAGTVSKAQLSPHMGADVYHLDGEYACREMIGQVRSEEIIQGNGKRN